MIDYLRYLFRLGGDALQERVFILQHGGVPKKPPVGALATSWLRREKPKMETNIVRFPSLMGQPLTRAELDRLHDGWGTRAWTQRPDGRCIAVVRDMTFHVWANHKGGWNWRIDYRDGERISGRNCRNAKGAVIVAAWCDRCRRDERRTPTPPEAA
jgi:hypothetical protein